MIKKFLMLFVSVNLIAESIVIDGNLDEPEWQTAFKITEFFESDPYTLRKTDDETEAYICLLYTSPSPRDSNLSRMPSSA